MEKEQNVSGDGMKNARRCTCSLAALRSAVQDMAAYRIML